jgi:ABC-type transport system involved in cytochrome c biogenesis permease subunit
MLTTAAFVVTLILIIDQIVKLFRKRAVTYEIEQVLFLLGSLLLFIDFGYRSYMLRFPAVTNTYEALIIFAAGIHLLLFFVSRRVPAVREAGQSPGSDAYIQFIGTMVVFVFLALASSPLIPDDLVPPIPALQSHWLVMHVLLSFAGEAFFVIAFASALVYLLSSQQEKRDQADRITYVSVTVGYFLFTVGALIFGMVWAEQAWGSYWSWDPKETWALVTWLTYTLYLHLRFIRGARGKITAWVAVIGFALTMFTFFGVNYLMSGLHSYV